MPQDNLITNLRRKRVQANCALILLVLSHEYDMPVREILNYSKSANHPAKDVQRLAMYIAQVELLCDQKSVAWAFGCSASKVREVVKIIEDRRDDGRFDAHVQDMVQTITQSKGGPSVPVKAALLA